MPLPEIVAAYGLLAVILYGVLGGADFGGGVWDLFASGPRYIQQREVVARAMGPVWEANHIWLIFVIVVIFTGFPTAFYVLCLSLFVPFHLVLLGITLRGAAFVYRGPHATGKQTSYWSYIFGMASVMTPVFLGMTMGAVASGRIHWENEQVTTGGIPYLSPLAFAMGCFALALCAYMAAIFLTKETTGALQEDFRKRAVLAGTSVVVFTVLMPPLVYLEARHLWDGLHTVRALPVVVAGGLAMLLSGWFLMRRQYNLARISASAQVVFLLTGWGLAQYPYIIYPDITLAGAATEASTLMFLTVTVPLGLLVLVPSLVLLFRVFKQETFQPDEG